MSYHSIMQQIRKGNTSPVYVCYGQETYLLRQFLNELLDVLVEPTMHELAVNRYDLNEQAIDVVLEDAETLPFMVPNKVIIANNAYFLTGTRQKQEVEHDLERLQQYINSPVDFSILILIAPADKLDARRSIVKTLQKQAVVIPFQPLSGRELMAWVSSEFAKFNCTIQPNAVQSLIGHVGPQMQLLANEIQKIALFSGMNSEVTTELVESLVIRSLEQNIFKLIDHIVARRTDDAFTLLNDMLLQREDPVKILLLIARQFRIVSQVAELASQGKTPQQMASHLQLRPFMISNALDQSKYYNRHTLQRIMTHLGQLDYEMKTGKVDKQLALELLILKLA